MRSAGMDPEALRCRERRETASDAEPLAKNRDEYLSSQNDTMCVARDKKEDVRRDTIRLPAVPPNQVQGSNRPLCTHTLAIGCSRMAHMQLQAGRQRRRKDKITHCWAMRDATEEAEWAKPDCRMENGLGAGAGFATDVSSHKSTTTKRGSGVPAVRAANRSATNIATSCCTSWLANTEVREFLPSAPRYLHHSQPHQSNPHHSVKDMGLYALDKSSPKSAPQGGGGHHTAQHSTAQHSTAQHSTAPRTLQSWSAGSPGP